MNVDKLIESLHPQIEAFSERTNGISTAAWQGRKLAEWEVKYNILKVEFVLTKKDRVFCPLATLFCRIYLGKNEAFFYHLPELMPFLEPDNFQCYYFPYIESEERLRACFEVIASFIEKHLPKLQDLAKDNEMYEKIKAAKLADMKLFDEKFDEEMEVFEVGSYEEYLLLPKYAAEGAYQEFVCGNYEKAMKSYEKEVKKKGKLTAYERNLISFLKTTNGTYQAIPEKCASVKKMQYVKKSEDRYVFLGFAIFSLALALVYFLCISALDFVQSQGTLYYKGLQWWEWIVYALFPGLWGGMLLRDKLRHFFNKEKKEEYEAFEEMQEPKWLKILVMVMLAIMTAGSVFLFGRFAIMPTCFYEDYMTYKVEEDVIGIKTIVCPYEELETVYYTQGVYNEYGDYISRPSYVLVFKGGSFWDSDIGVSVKEVETHILPLLEDYYDDIVTIEDRSHFWEKEQDK